jgi:hypothetical protein
LDYIAQCATATSLLPTLEPMAGASLAINLAYLNLEKARYRAAIFKRAKEEIQRLTESVRKNSGESELPEYIVKSKLFQQVARLAVDPDDAEAAKTSAPLPDKFWGKIFRMFFENHRDRRICYVLTAFSLAAFVFGTAHSFKHLMFFSCVSAGFGGYMFYYALLLGIGFPILFLFFGGRMMKWARDLSIDNIGELERMMQRMIPGAHVKPAIENEPVTSPPVT